MVTVPTAQGVIARVFKKKLQRRRFDVAVAENHVGFALVTGSRVTKSFQFGQTGSRKNQAAQKIITDSHHFAWSNHV
jgi:hypothetical protein